jgi:aspartyl-tRNA(Asn)/glutamyl-tRNA(Gln) amidotransferase subunit B
MSAKRFRFLECWKGLNPNMDTYTPIVGMEIHVELKTNSKMFCGCKNDPFHAPKPNMYTCPVCLGMPGALPVPNKKAVEWTILLGLALGCDISLFSKFDRKNYFYPDLAKGYQISQYDQPLCTNGKVTVTVKDGTGKEYEKTVRIHRVHLEEDTGKLQHADVDGKKATLVDFNRSGVPLVEIVTEADIRSGEEAKAFLKALHQIVRYLDISGADMEKGSMRLEPNISVSSVIARSESSNDEAIPSTSSNPVEIASSKTPRNDVKLPPYKVEVKNINSFNFVKKAIEYEVARHIEIIKKGELPVQETRGWNENKNATFSQRLKEEANDYRYFPEPDIPPMRFTRDSIESLRKTLPELPIAKRNRFVSSYQLSLYDAGLLTDPKELADYFEETVKKAGSALTPKAVANWIINKKVDSTSMSADDLIKTIQSATTVVSVSDDEMKNAIEKVLAANAKAVTDYKAGKQQIIGFLLGLTLKELNGKGDKSKIMELLRAALQY